MKQEKQMAELYLSFVIPMQMGISFFLCHPEEDSKPTNESNLFRKILDTSSAALGKIVSLKSIEDSAILFLETIFFFVLRRSLCLARRSAQDDKRKTSTLSHPAPAGVERT